MSAHDDHATYRKLIDLLDDAGASYRVIDHAPEGRTDVVSRLRGHDPACAAKCVIVMAKLDKKTKQYVLAVVPGDLRVDLAEIKSLLSAKYVGFADNDAAERLAGSGSGTILPLSFHDDLRLVVDPRLLDHDEIYFNAARMDRSLALATADYRRVADPWVRPVAADPAPGGEPSASPVS